MTDLIKAEPVAWIHHHPRLPDSAFLKPLPRGADELGWTETPLYTHAQLVEERRLAWNEAIEAAAREVALERRAGKSFLDPAFPYDRGRLHAAAAIRALTKEISDGDV